jgi:hypothetical protein
LLIFLNILKIRKYMNKKLSRRYFVKEVAITSVSVVAAAQGLRAAAPVASIETVPVPGKVMCNMKNKLFRNDGLCNPLITIRPYQLLSTVCILGGAKCPMMEAGKAAEVLEKVKTDPTTTIRLVSNVDEIPHFTSLGPTDHASPDIQDVLNRKRDLDVLQRLGLVPGDTRRARYLYELLFSRIETTDNLCSYSTPGWEGCSLAHSGAYESVQAKGWNAVVYNRSDQERAEYRQRNVKLINSSTGLFVRPHHLMCMSCWYGDGKDLTPRPNDSIFEIWQRIRKEPDISITLVEGTCMACDCCDGFHPSTGRCVHSCGLIRDYKKDLDCFQKLGLMPGASMKAREFFSLLFERIPSTRDICAYGDGIVRSNEWLICSSPDGNPGYAKARLAGIFSA